MDGYQLEEMRGSFAHGVLEEFHSLGRAETARFSKGLLRASEQADAGRLERPLGHPAFADLPIGGSGHCDAVAVFLDLSDFTGRTFWEPPQDVVRLARAVLTQVLEVVFDFGGHALGLRGDGVFACFGGPDSLDPDLDTTVALGACAFALDATEGALNNLLRIEGVEPVQLRAGVDFGRLDFVRTGTEEASEVNVIGFAANFAAKAEKYANSWELVAGDGLAKHVPDRSLLTAHQESPKVYQRDYERRTYPFYQVHWRALLPHLSGVREALAGAPTSRAKII